MERLRLPRGDLGRRAEVRHREDQEQDGRPRRAARRRALQGRRVARRRLRHHQRRPLQHREEAERRAQARRLRHRAHRHDGALPEGRQLGRLSRRRCAGLRVRDARLRQGHRARRARQRHLGLRGASERERGRHQPALALDHDPDHGHDHGRDLRAQGAGGRLRRRQGLRIPVRRARRSRSPARSARRSIRWRSNSARGSPSGLRSRENGREPDASLPCFVDGRPGRHRSCLGTAVAGADDSLHRLAVARQFHRHHCEAAGRPA